MKDNESSKIAIFDLDNTLTKTSTSSILAKDLFLKRELPAKFILKNCFSFIYHKLKRQEMPLNSLNSIVETSLNYIKGKNDDDFYKYVQTLFIKKNHKIFYKNSLEFLEKERNNGKRLILATAAPSPVAKYFKELLNFDEVVSTELEIFGRIYTGKLSSNFCHGAYKAHQVKDLIKQAYPNCSSISFYSDSANDLPLMHLSDSVTCINPSRSLKKICYKHDYKFIYTSLYVRFKFFLWLFLSIPFLVLFS